MLAPPVPRGLRVPPRSPVRPERTKKRTTSNHFAQVAQLVEQRTENPRVDSSILSLGTTLERRRRGAVSA